MCAIDFMFVNSSLASNLVLVAGPDRVGFSSAILLLGGVRHRATGERQSGRPRGWSLPIALHDIRFLDGDDIDTDIRIDTHATRYDRRGEVYFALFLPSVHHLSVVVGGDCGLRRECIRKEFRKEGQLMLVILESGYPLPPHCSTYMTLSPKYY